MLLLAVYLVIAATATAQHQPQQHGFPPGLLFWLPSPFLQHQPALVKNSVSHAVTAKAAQSNVPINSPTQLTYGLLNGYLGSYFNYPQSSNHLSGVQSRGYGGYGLPHVSSYSAPQNTRPALSVVAPPASFRDYGGYGLPEVSSFSKPSPRPAPSVVAPQESDRDYDVFESPEPTSSQHQEPTPVKYNDPVPFTSDPAPAVITQGLHLGDDPENYGDDAPATVITRGPLPGAYTAVSSDEPSEATQFHSQDGLGHVIFGHSSPDQARLETRDKDGTVRGSYSYVNPDGRTIKITYTAGEGGFQAVEDPSEDGGVLPKQVTETPEVAAARALHARLYDQAKWLAEIMPDDEPVVNQPPKPVQDTSSVVVGAEHQPGSNADLPHPPDSLYTNLGTVGVEEDEELSYYGAAKGKPLPYSSQVNNPVAPFDYYGVAGKTHHATPLAYTGSYHFPSVYRTYPETQSPVLSPHSAPTLNEQQHLHRVAPSKADEHPESRSSDPSSSKPDNLEYFGAAKLLAFSAANSLFNQPSSNSHRGGKSLSQTEQPAPEARFSSYHQTAPVFVGVGVAPEAEHDQPLLRTALAGTKPAPSSSSHSSENSNVGVPPASVSQKAAYFGAVPVAAVHDTQVSPNQNVKDHQKLPVYIEAN